MFNLKKLLPVKITIAAKRSDKTAKDFPKQAIMASQQLNENLSEEPKISINIPMALYNKIITDDYRWQRDASTAQHLLSELKATLSESEGLCGSDQNYATKCFHDIVTLKKLGFIQPHLPTVHRTEGSVLKGHTALLKRMEYFHWLRCLKVAYYSMCRFLLLF